MYHLLNSVFQPALWIGSLILGEDSRWKTPCTVTARAAGSAIPVEVPQQPGAALGTWGPESSTCVSLS